MTGRVLPILVFILAAACRHATDQKYGLKIVASPAEYKVRIAADPDHRMVDLSRIDPSIRFDIRYATSNNFMKKPLYPRAAAFLRAPAAEALAQVQRELAARGVGLLIFDAYRPYTVTEQMWAEFGPSGFVADPAKGSRHNRGAAVDLTVVMLDTGRELEMPTPYDDFTEKAAHDFQALPPDALANRAVLREAMERHGFEALANEWWHYDYGGWRAFDLLDLSFDQLEAAQ